MFSTRAQSWQMSEYNLGLGMMSSNAYGSEFETMKKHFPNAKYIDKDFSSYAFSTDAYLYNTRSFNVEFNFGIGLVWIKPNHRFSGRILLRPYGGVSNFELMYDNKEKVNEIAVDSIERDYYSFWWEERYRFLGSDIVLTSRLKGKKQRWRFWAGALATLGVGSGTFNSFHSYGRIKFKERDLINGTYVYTYDPNSGKYVSNEYTYNVNSHAVMRLGLPIGLEFAMGKQRQFRYGAEFRFGTLLIAGNGYNLSSGFVNFLSVFRWVIQPFGADKIPEGFDVEQ
jgi:hypothetical protein